jgi:hypothetical protein
MLAEEYQIQYHNKTISYGASTKAELQAAKNDEKSSDLRGEKLQQHIKDNFLQV